MTTAEFIAESSGLRLDKFLAERLSNISRSQLRKLLDQGLVTVGGKKVKASHRLTSGDVVKADIPTLPSTTPSPEPLPLNIVYEDKDILVIDKPSGITVHPAPGNPHHTLVNAILNHCPTLPYSNPPDRPGIVHRLDKDTSGLMVVAKTAEARENLMNQFKSRSVVKGYTTLVNGHLKPEIGAIEAPIGRDPAHRKRMAVIDEGREARTGYRVMEYLDDHTLLEVTPETGRTHQIRVHLSAIGYPVFGDTIYGRRSSHLSRQFLHASFLGFNQPTTGEYLEFTSSLPTDLKLVLATLGKIV